MRSLQTMVIGFLLASGLLLIVALPVSAQEDLSQVAATNKIYLPVVVNGANNAEDAQVSNGNGLDPSFTFSEADLAAIAEADAKAQEYVDSLRPSNDMQAAFMRPNKVLLLERQWKEPNTAYYVNHCGPGATQVALDVRLSANSVPSIDTLATEEKTNVGKTGTYMNDICPVLNARLKLTAPRYAAASVDSASTLVNRTFNHVDSGYAFITGVMTTGMAG